MLYKMCYLITPINATIYQQISQVNNAFCDTETNITQVSHKHSQLWYNKSWSGN